MDLKQIKELMAAMERAGIKKLTIKQKGGDELHLERHEELAPASQAPVAFYPPPMYAMPILKQESLKRPGHMLTRLLTKSLPLRPRKKKNPENLSSLRSSAHSTLPHLPMIPISSKSAIASMKTLSSASSRR